MEHWDTTTIEEIQDNDLEQMTLDLTDKNGSRPGDHLIEEPLGEAIERLLESCKTSGDHNGKGHSTDQELIHQATSATLVEMLFPTQEEAGEHKACHQLDLLAPRQQDALILKMPPRGITTSFSVSHHLQA
ncbi:hypothetical protein LAZ67_22000369 [Cordylochernes scorpioides]|uniref:Uncharacterized protein n=1 Tax=Cordylochernes scorpioides TaxID=51811 RepID=A0ABY6LS36_9ARAC|nr:hypothetical protein LAZ67_22000369 [Cordylochernes scorpioides]